MAKVMKKIKFPLEMKDGVKVRTIEALRENFEAEKFISYYINGKLQMWLQDRHYDSYLKDIQELDIDDSDFMNKIYSVFSISSEAKKVDVLKIKKRMDKLKLLQQLTDDIEALNCIDNVVCNQEELDAKLKLGTDKVFLLGENYIINKDISNVIFKGINAPIIKVDSDDFIDFDKKHVLFVNCRFEEKYVKIIEEELQKRMILEYESSLYMRALLNAEAIEKSKKLYAIAREFLMDYKKLK